MSLYSREEISNLARSARLVLAMLQSEDDGVHALEAEIGDDANAWRAIAIDLAGAMCEYMCGRYNSQDGAIRQAMRLIAWRLDKAAEL